MSTPILATKLYIPSPPPIAVHRLRLVEQLNHGLCEEGGFRQQLTLISAPAGFGKTTLLSEWISTCQRSAAWLSLDEHDSDLTRFLVYLVAALRSVLPNIGEQEMAALQNSQPPPTESILTSLLNDISALPNDFIFVLDDYHVIDSQAVDHALTFILDHLPPQMHLVITTREDPGLPIARLRARGQLTELRAADLRFTPAEAAEFLNRMMGLNLTDEDIRALETRTEGWIAGLQLAALSMKGHEDIHGFIQAFAGDHRYIVDYLIEEVLQRQSDCVRSFLLQTSILERLNGALCDAVTSQAECNVLLETLERGNYFVIPLDDQRHWYRYHHLFGDVLRMRLIAEQPDQIPVLHRRASVWFEQNGLGADAIRHALIAKDFTRAADLIELAYPPMSRGRQEVTMLGWLRALPDTVVRGRPVLCNLYAGVLMQTGEMEGVEAWLLAAERWLSSPPERNDRPDVPPPAMIVLDQEEFRRLPGAVAMHRAGQALMLGNVDETIRHARRVLDLAPEDDFLRRGGAATLTGLAYWTRGDLEEARQLYTDGMPLLQRAGNITDVIGCALALADIHIAQGRLRDAMRIYEQALQLAADQGMPTMRGTADMLVGMSELYRDQNDLQAATQALMRSKAQGEHTGLPQNRYRWYASMAGIRQAEGDLNGALELLNEAERRYAGDFSPNVRPIAAMKARIWAAQGRLTEAFDWARQHGFSAEDSLSYLHEFEHITLARILLARYKIDPVERSILEATGLLDRLLQAAQEGKRKGSEIEILLLQALALQTQAGISAALVPLERALTLAEPEGYVRIFVDEGAPMAALLREAAARGIMPGYTGTLLAAFESERQPAAPINQAVVGPQSQSAGDVLVEALSERELDVLRLFNTELSGPEIARELMIALSTVRTHTKSIFSKLNVNNRRTAVKRAAELGLL